MFIVNITYSKPASAVDAQRAAHKAYIEQHFAAGTFVLSGRKDTRDGGVILVDIPSREELQTIIAQDPFHIHALADYQVIQFKPGSAAPALKSLLAG